MVYIAICKLIEQELYPYRRKLIFSFMRRITHNKTRNIHLINLEVIVIDILISVFQTPPQARLYMLIISGFDLRL